VPTSEVGHCHVHQPQRDDLLIPQAAVQREVAQQHGALAGQLQPDLGPLLRGDDPFLVGAIHGPGQRVASTTFCASQPWSTATRRIARSSDRFARMVDTS